MEKETLIGLLREQYTLWKDLTEGDPLREGIWDSIKYGASKLGRLEKGGKIIGRGKEEAAADNQVEEMLARKSNKLLQQLVADINSKYPNFPNCKSPDDFLAGVEEMGAFYDSILQASLLGKGATGGISPSLGNRIIEDLRVVVKHYLDFKLSTVYQTLTEGVNGPITSSQTDSTTMKTLESNTLPKLLASLGGALGAFGWIVKTPYIQELIKTLFQHKEYVSDLVDKDVVLQSLKKGEGLTQLLSRLYHVDLGPNASPKAMAEIITKVGDGDFGEGVRRMGGCLKNPDMANRLAGLKFTTLKTLGEFFDQDTIRSGKGGSWFETIPNGGITKTIVQSIIKGIAVKGTGAAVAASGLGTILAPLGVGLLAAGATVYLLRRKGRKNSRAQQLNDLLLSLHAVPRPSKMAGKTISPKSMASFGGGGPITVSPITSTATPLTPSTIVNPSVVDDPNEPEPEIVIPQTKPRYRIPTGPLPTEPVEPPPVAEPTAEPKPTKGLTASQTPSGLRPVIETISAQTIPNAAAMAQFLPAGVPWPNVKVYYDQAEYNKSVGGKRPKGLKYVVQPNKKIPPAVQEKFQRFFDALVARGNANTPATPPDSTAQPTGGSATNFAKVM